ncbi:hypothetical protein OHA25_61060 (plasmid) [Nonomuraea sp. NBC_00507]
MEHPGTPPARDTEPTGGRRHHLQTDPAAAARAPAVPAHRSVEGPLDG